MSKNRLYFNSSISNLKGIFVQEDPEDDSWYSFGKLYLYCNGEFIYYWDEHECKEVKYIATTKDMAEETYIEVAGL